MSEDEAARRIKALEDKVALLERIFSDLKAFATQIEQKNRELKGVS